MSSEPDGCIMALSTVACLVRHAGPLSLACGPAIEPYTHAQELFLLFLVRHSGLVRHACLVWHAGPDAKLLVQGLRELIGEVLVDKVDLDHSFDEPPFVFGYALART
jgi:hypothetical protein